MFGFVTALMLSRSAFPMPFPIDRLLRVGVAVGAMAIVVRLVTTTRRTRGQALLFVVIPAGVAVYVASAWLLDIGGLRASLKGMTLARLRFGDVSLMREPRSSRIASLCRSGCRRAS